MLCRRYHGYPGLHLQYHPLRLARLWLRCAARANPTQPNPPPRSPPHGCPPLGTPRHAHGTFLHFLSFFACCAVSGVPCNCPPHFARPVSLDTLTSQRSPPPARFSLAWSSPPRRPILCADHTAVALIHPKALISRVTQPRLIKNLLLLPHPTQPTTAPTSRHLDDLRCAYYSSTTSTNTGSSDLLHRTTASAPGPLEIRRGSEEQRAASADDTGAYLLGT